MKKKTLGVVRHILTMLGGVLVAKGYMDTELTHEITGIVISIIGVTWSVIEKNKNGDNE